MKRQLLIRKLKNKDYRDAYVASRIKTDMAFQIRLLREANGWTQGELAKRLGVTQPRISELEDPSYGRYSTSTLQKLASVFDVALVQRFAPFSELVDWTSGLSSGSLCPKRFSEDIRLQEVTDQRADCTSPSRIITPPAGETGEGTGSSYNVAPISVHLADEASMRIEYA